MRRRRPPQSKVRLASRTFGICGFTWVARFGGRLLEDAPSWRCPKCKCAHDDGARRRGERRMLGRRLCHKCSGCAECKRQWAMPSEEWLELYLARSA